MPTKATDTTRVTNEERFQAAHNSEIRSDTQQFQAHRNSAVKVTLVDTSVSA